MNDDELDPNMGEITEIREDTFWGVFNDGTTFDMPLGVLDGHSVGTKVLRRGADEDDDEDETYDHSFMMIGEDYATVIICNDAENGFEILEVMRYTKADFLRDEGRLN